MPHLSRHRWKDSNRNRYGGQVNRRELLKYFGIGTVIAPVAGMPPIAAKLIEELKLIEVPVKEFTPKISVTWKDKQSGKTYIFQLIQSHATVVDVTRLQDQFRNHTIVVGAEIEWKLKGPGKNHFSELSF